MYVRYFKRPLDFSLALVALIILAPLLLVTALLVRIKLGSPILFKQDRPGKDEKIFTMYKFRTMTDEANPKGQLLSDEERLTQFGKLLRSTSLDELPSLINIFKGDMSIVGPRPLLVEYLSLYNEKQRRRHESRPGLTGLAQVNGRNLVKWEKRFDLDIEYIDNITFLNDLKIFIKTIKAVFVREGISGEESVTMKPFKGTK